MRPCCPECRDFILFHGWQDSTSTCSASRKRWLLLYSSLYSTSLTSLPLVPLAYSLIFKMLLLCAFEHHFWNVTDWMDEWLNTWMCEHLRGGATSSTVHQTLLLITSNIACKCAVLYNLRVSSSPSRQLWEMLLPPFSLLYTWRNWGWVFVRQKPIKDKLGFQLRCSTPKRDSFPLYHITAF